MQPVQRSEVGGQKSVFAAVVDVDSVRLRSGQALASMPQLAATCAFDSHVPDAHPFGLPVHVAPLPAGSIQSGG
jgi:hypothetical protein